MEKVTSEESARNWAEAYQDAETLDDFIMKRNESESFNRSNENGQNELPQRAEE